MNGSQQGSNAGGPTIRRLNESAGKLIGWLVSYAGNAQGQAHELRTGRFIVSSPAGQAGNAEERLIAIEEQSVSAPHAAMNALPNHKLVVQDIFSQHGSYLTKANSAQETPITGPVEVGHGDWIRLGERTRFQVCLVDAPAK